MPVDNTVIADNATRSAPRRAWVALAVLVLPTLLVSMDFSVLYLAVPHLSADLGPTSTQQLWIIDIYGFMIAGFLVTMGTLGDRIGRRKLLLIGAAVFGLALVLAAFSTSAPMLIASRALLGVAGATLMPSTLALISNMFQNPRQHGVAIAVWLSCFMGGLAIGPAVGGLMLDHFWWGSVFLLGVPVMLVLMVAGPLLLPEYRAPGARRPDLVSVALSLAAILPVIYGLKELARDGLHAQSVGAIVVGLAAGVVFVRRQQASPNPLLDLRLFGNPRFRAALVILMVGGVVGTGTYLLVSLHLQNVEGLSPLAAGLWLVPPTLVMIVSNMAAPLLARRVNAAYVVAAGLVIAAAGYLLLTLVGSAGGLGVLVTGFTVALAGNGLMASLGNAIALGSTPPEKAGAAASIVQTNNELGLGLGVALLGSLGSAVYRGRLTDTLPATVPPDAAAFARESIDRAVAASAHLPAPLDAQLLAAARDAFTAALHTVGFVGAVIFAALAVFAAVALRRAAAPDVRQTQHIDDGSAAVPIAQRNGDRRRRDRRSTLTRNSTRSIPLTRPTPRERKQ
jgi:DHA2 family multidrug resistance protein-like MFS transporter